MDFMDFYQKHQGFVRRCASEVAKKYGWDDISEDLVSEGMLAAYRQIDRYDEQRGASVTTFLYQHIMGAMRREAARHFGLSWRQFKERREAGALSLAAGVSLDEPMEEGGYALHEIIPASQRSVERQVYIRIGIEHLRPAYEQLSFKEREILAGYFELYGHKKETLAEIGEAFQIKESAVLKAKNKALEKLRRICMDGGLEYWMSIWAAIREAQKDCVVGRGDLGRYREPEGCEGVE